MAEPESERTQRATPRPGGPVTGSTGGRKAGDSTGPWRDNAPSEAGTPRVGRYEIRGTLGRGACGAVYRAFDPELGREVAVKVPRPEGLTDEGRERFVREARAAARVHHANVCPIYDVGVDGEVPFLVMRFVPGGTLAGLLEKSGGVLPVHEAVGHAHGLALGVAAAHAEGVVHRDLKPGNVLWDAAARQVQVTDFGLARVRGEASSSVTGQVLGTPLYMSPEQARGRITEVGPLSDVYSLGVILYELLTGRTPYHGDSALDVMLQACEGNPPPPSTLRTGLDPELEVVCLRAMAVEPADRYPSAQAFADALGGFLRSPDGADGRGAGIAPRKPPVAADWGRLRDGLRLVWVGMLVLTVLLIGDGIYSLVRDVGAVTANRLAVRNWPLWVLLIAGELAAWGTVAAGRWRCRTAFPGAGPAGWSARAAAGGAVCWVALRVVQLAAPAPAGAGGEEPSWGKTVTGPLFAGGVAFLLLTEGLFAAFAARFGRAAGAGGVRVVGRAAVVATATAVALAVPSVVVLFVYSGDGPKGQAAAPEIVSLLLGYCCAAPLFAAVWMAGVGLAWAGAGVAAAHARSKRGLAGSLLTAFPSRPGVRWPAVATVLLYPVVLVLVGIFALPRPAQVDAPGPPPSPGSGGGPGTTPLAPIGQPNPEPPAVQPNGAPLPVPNRPAAPPPYRRLDGLPRPVTAIAWSGDGKTLAAGCGAHYNPFGLFDPPTAPGTVAVWDAAAGGRPLWSKEATDQGDKCSVAQVFLTRDGATLWSGFQVEKGGLIDLSGKTRGRTYAWAWRRDELIHRRDEELAAVTPDGAYAVVTHALHGRVRWLRGADLADVGYSDGPKGASGGFPERVDRVALDPVGLRLAVGWGSSKMPAAVGIVDLTPQGKVNTPGRVPTVVTAEGEDYVAQAFAPDGGPLVLLGRDGQVSTWGGSGTARKRFPTDIDPAVYNRVRVSPDGRRVALNSRNGFVCLWDLQTGGKIATIDTGAAGRPLTFEFRPTGGELAIGTQTGAVVLWPLD